MALDLATSEAERLRSSTADVPSVSSHVPVVMFIVVTKLF